MYNINSYIYIQITEVGWEHLNKTVGESYIKSCIKTPSVEKIIKGETWYRLQCWVAFDLMPPCFGSQVRFKSTVMFDDIQMADVD